MDELYIAPLFCCPSGLERYRVRSDLSNQCNGELKIRDLGLDIIFSDVDGWEHVSVSRKTMTPSHDDMDWIKKQFWPDSLCVMQLHINESNFDPTCLHLWRPSDQEIPQPPDGLTRNLC